MIFVLYILLLMCTNIVSASIVYTGTSWDTSASGNIKPTGITMDSTYFWITNYDISKVYKYTLDGTYTGIHWDTTASGCEMPTGIIMDSTYFWITDYWTEKVYKYTLDGTYTGTSWDTSASGCSHPSSITMDSTYFWITDNNDDKVYKYTLDGTYTGTSWDTSASGNNKPEGIITNGIYFWITDYEDDEVYKYFNNTPPTISTSFTDLGTHLIDHTPTITWTEGTDADSDPVSTYVYVGTTSTPVTLEGSTAGETLDLGSTVSLTDGNTYYYRLRSYDGYEWSDYTTADEFRMNSLPTVATGYTDLGTHLIDHTPAISWTEGTDAEADTITTYVYVGSTSTPTTAEGSTTNEVMDLGSTVSLTNGNIYYYRTRTWDGYEYSGYTSSDSFRMNTPPTVPTGATDLGLRLLDHTPTVSWSASSDDESDSITYYVESQDNVAVYDADWNGVEITTTLDANTWSDGEVGKWRIKSYDGYEYSAYTTEDSFKMNTLPTTTSLLIQGATNPQNIISFTPTFAWTYNDSDSDAQNSYTINVGTTVGTSNMWDSGAIISTDTSKIYDGSILSRGTLYYLRVRTNDSYEDSTYVSGTFKINSLPVISNVTISPVPAIETNDLTAHNDTVVDADGNGITLYYKWYKDNVLQTALNNESTILASNLTTDDVWKVGIIPFDTYESGAELQSSTVTIGSSNYAPTTTGITTDKNMIKWNKTLTVSTLNASDVNNDNYTFYVGSSSGLSDICTSSSTPNGTEASCSFLMNHTTGSYTLYGRLSDGNDTSVERSIVYTVDETPPVLNSSSISPTSFTNDESTTISASVTVANGTVDWVKVKIRDNAFISTNYTMSLVNGTYKYVYSPAAAGNYLITYFYASDDSGNIMSQSAIHAFEVVTGGTGGGTGGGAPPANVTIVGDLTLTPDRRDTYFFYTAISGEQKGVYKFIANRNVDTCKVEPNSDATCEIVDGYTIEVTLTVDENVKAYDGVLTVTDENDYVATSSLVVRIIKLWGALPIGTWEVGGLASLLDLFFETTETALVGIRTWFVALILGIFGFAFYKVYSL